MARIITSFKGGGKPPWMPNDLDYGAIRLAYDLDADILYLMFGPRRPTITVENPGVIWYRIDAETREICGVEIQGFEAVFLKMHERLAATWGEIKGQRLDTLDAGARASLAKRILKRTDLIDDHARVPA